MNVTRFLKKINRILELGPAQSLHLIKNRITQKLFAHQWRTKALTHTAAHSWHTIAHNHALDWNVWWPSLTQQTLPLPPLDKQATRTQVQHIIHNRFNILGSGLQQLTTIPWHEDFRLKQQSPWTECHFDDQLFYKDIIIAGNLTDQLSKDIKVPWELSRCQHLPILGHAHTLEKDLAYVQKFRVDIINWIEKNPYLLGTNWVCPMEVGIRAINWIWAWHFFKHEQSLDTSYWQRFVSSLYDHVQYLENNWEFYDGRTSNHYLSDLIGYYYLCWFFSSIDTFKTKAQWCHQEILREWDKQIFEEGTDYEGSTQYHRLVTELFSHFLLVSKALHISVPQKYHHTFQRMLDFIDWCTPHNGMLVSIGDHDSGKIVYYSAAMLAQKNCFMASCPTCPSKPWRSRKEGRAIASPYLRAIKQYPQFGLSILKTNDIHLTLRHHAYTPNQPSGHIHNDALSITVQYKNIPLFVDPGSYVYTPSSIWRNTFRSVSAHNTFYIKDHEPIPFDDRLFALTIPVHKKNNSAVSLQSAHQLYQRFGLKAHREIKYENRTVTITDSWFSIAHNPLQEKLQSCWNFTLHPDITAIKHHNHIALRHNNDTIATMYSAELDFSVHETWVSEEYGSRRKSSCLRAERPLKYALNSVRASFGEDGEKYIPVFPSVNQGIAQDEVNSGLWDNHNYKNKAMCSEMDTQKKASHSVVPEGRSSISETVLEGSVIIILEFKP